MDGKIKRFVYRVRGRLREQLVIDNLIKFTGIGMLIAVVVSLIALVVPFYYGIVVATIVLVLSFCAGIIWGIRKTPSPMQAALMADAKGYQEKLTTAFFLQGKEDAFSQLQKKDAMRIVEQFQIRREFPIRIQWKQTAVLFLLTIVFVVSSLVDTPAKREAIVKHDVSKETKEELARLEKVEKELEKHPELAQNEVADVKEQLKNARKELKEAESYEDLKKAEERINKKLEMASKDMKDKTLAQMMEEAAKEGQEAEKEKEEQLAKEAKEALEKAEKGNEKDKQEAYEKLKKLAAATGDENLSQVAEAYKESSYSDSDYAAATQSLNETIHNMQGTDMAQNTNSNRENNSNQSNSNQNNSNQNNGQNSSGQNSNNQNNNQSSNGQNNGNRNSNQSGQNGNGQGGSGAGAGNGGNGYGDGWNYGGMKGKEGDRKTAEDITVPNGEIGDDENLTGKANGNDSSITQKSNQSKAWSGNKVSYGEVSGKYKDKAYKKVDGSNYPSKLKDKIRNYFDGLN